MTPNTHNVPKAQWSKWNDAGKETFDWLHGLMVTHPDLFSHPKMARVPQEHWKTVSWNAAWLAADAATKAAKPAAKSKKAAKKKVAKKAVKKVVKKKR